MNSSVLITGATGYFGSRIAMECLARGWRVVAMARDCGEVSARSRVHKALRRLDPEKFPSLEKQIEVFAADITDDDVWSRSLGITVDAVIHVAADVKNAADSAKTMATNVAGTLNILNWTKANADNFIYIGTAYSAGRASAIHSSIANESTRFDSFNNEYERSKSLAQQAVRESGLNWSILRPSILTHEVDREESCTIEDPIGVHGWFRLARICNDIAIRMGIPIVRIPARQGALLDVISARGAARLVYNVAESMIRLDSTSPHHRSETLIAGLKSISVDEMLEIAHDQGLHRLQMDAAEDFVPLSLPEKIYCQQGGFFVAYACQRLVFDASRVRQLFPQSELLEEVQNVDLRYCTGYRSERNDLEIKMRKLKKTVANQRAME